MLKSFVMTVLLIGYWIVVMRTIFPIRKIICV